MKITYKFIHISLIKFIDFFWKILLVFTDISLCVCNKSWMHEKKTIMLGHYPFHNYSATQTWKLGWIHAFECLVKTFWCTLTYNYDLKSMDWWFLFPFKLKSLFFPILCSRKISTNNTIFILSRKKSNLLNWKIL